MPDVITIKAINDHIEEGSQQLQVLLLIFTQENADASKSPNYSDGEKDDLLPLARLLNNATVKSNRILLNAIMQTLKICARKPENREHLLPEVVHCVIGNFETFGDMDDLLMINIANFILNACYQAKNAVLVLPAVPHLVATLGVDALEVKVAVVGALQSLCTHTNGKASVIAHGAVPAVLTQMSTDHPDLVARCAGVLHNVSTIWPGVFSIYEHNGLPLVVPLLQSPSLEVKRHAAAILQNCSRDPKSVQTILLTQAIGLLSQLLFQEDLATQLSATRALLNLHGPCGDPTPERRALKAALGQSIALGQLRSLLEGDTGSVPSDPP